jgi:uncharacterized protein
MGQLRAQRLARRPAAQDVRDEQRLPGESGHPPQHGGDHGRGAERRIRRGPGAGETVQHRGGPPGFLHVLDDHTIGWADFKGNLQYVSVGNLSHDSRVSLIVMDYAHQQRLKIFGHARVASVEDEPDLVARLTHPDYHAVVERGIVVTVDAFDWNCRQHITPRYSAAELEPALAGLRQRLATAEAEVMELRRELGADRPTDN